VKGSALVADGAPVRLRGVAVGDPLLDRRDRPVSDYTVLAADWRCNCVRISVHPTTWRNQPTKTLALLDRDVAAALANGLWPIIDWHVIGWPDGYRRTPDPGWGLPPDAFDSGWELARSFWQVMAGRYGGDGRVLFELWNEPVRDPKVAESPGADWPELKARYAELLALVRRRGDNVVLLGGDRWAGDLRGIRADPVAGRNVAYAWHVYPEQARADPARLAQRLDDLDRAAPVVVTEWGFCRDCAGQHFLGTPEGFGDGFAREFLDGRGLSWTAWAWYPSVRPAMIESD
jgi:hypothetical protein